MKNMAEIYAALLVSVCVDVGGEKLDACVRSVLSLMSRRGDTHLMNALVAAVPEAYDRAMGGERITVTMARKDRAAVSRIAAAMGRPSSQMHVQEDADLIGGVRVRVGDTLMDASVDGALNQLTSALA